MNFQAQDINNESPSKVHSTSRSVLNMSILKINLDFKCYRTIIKKNIIDKTPMVSGNLLETFIYDYESEIKYKYYFSNLVCVV